MSVRVTNAVMVMRKWVKRLKNTRVPALWYQGFREVSMYQCLICKETKQGHHNMYDHLIMEHRKTIHDEHYMALTRMKEPKDDKCMGEGASKQGVEFSVGDTPQPT